jgi:hypothetical protein
VGRRGEMVNEGEYGANTVYLLKIFQECGEEEMKENDGVD